MAGLDEILKLQQPTTQASDGTGITSGLTELAEGFEQFNQEVDNAEDPKQIMDLIRGDSATVDQRRAELAGYVGETDASKTPESVLTIVQPLFEAMEVAQNPSTMQEEAMPMEQDASLQGGIVQSPGMEEAISRINMGEQPRNFYMGGMNELFAAQQRGLDARANPNMYTASVAEYSPYLQNYPSTQLVDMDKVMNLGRQYMVEGTQYLNQPRDMNTILAEQQKFLAPYIKKPRTIDQIMAQREALGLGDDVKKQANIQNALALARFGAGVASEGGEGLGGLLQALTAQAPGLTKDLGQVSAMMAEAERKEKEGALAIATQEKLAKEQQDLQIAFNAINQYNAENKNFEQFRNELFKTGVSNALQMENVNVGAINQATREVWNANNNIGTMTELTYVVPVSSGGDGVPFRVKKTASGVVKFDGSPVPDNAIMINTQSYTDMNNGKANFSKAKAKNALIPNAIYNSIYGVDTDNDGVKDQLYDGSPLANAVSGFQQVPAYFTGDGYYWDVPVLNAEGQFVLQKKNLPRGSRINDETTLLSTSKDNAGRTFTTFKAGPNAGQTLMTSYPILGDAIQIDTDGDGTPDKIVNELNLDPSYLITPPKYDTNGQFVSGDPLAVPIANTGRPISTIPVEELKQLQRRFAGNIEVLNKTADILAVIPQSVGFGTNVASLATNVIAPFDPTTNKEWTQWLGTERGKQEMILFSKSLARALALSDRYAWAEQEFIINLAENPNYWFDNPDASRQRFQTLVKNIVNDVNFIAGELAGPNSNFQPHKLSPMPSGTKNDPIDFMGQGQINYLQVLQAQGNIDWNQANGGQGVYVRIPKQQGLQLGLTPGMFKNKNFLLGKVGVNKKGKLTFTN
tara:strand:+ start:799 stop:3378 length:2580 start_codon:yes stop_codon:yes gene_type:complete